jgi:hypothetical protein
MRFAKLTSVPPHLMLAAAAVGFAAWIAADALQGPPRETAGHQSDNESVEPRALPPDQALHAIHPGMPRALVEGRLSQLAPASPELGDEDETGAPVVRKRYAVELRAPVPHLMHGRGGAFRPGTYTLTVDFDTRHPVHALIAAHLAPAS